MDSYLFLAAIGPIQSFIASARRTSDLYFGSLLLSELSKAAAKSIADHCGLDSLIFPAPLKKEELALVSDLSVANKIIAVINQSPQIIGDAVHKAVIARLNQFKGEAYAGIGGKIENVVADLQIKDLVEYFWVAIPYEDEKLYVETRIKLEAMLAARKNTRNFSRVTWGSNQPKSSIDGQLECVIPDDKYPKKGEAKKAKEIKVQNLYTEYGAGPAERLSGVDLLKRQGALRKGFPSTSHMAAIPFLTRLNATKDSQTVKTAWQVYIKKLQPLAISRHLEHVSGPLTHSILGTYEGSLLFEERLVDVVDVETCDKNELQSSKEALSNFYKVVDTQLGRARPSPYYAILHADGDFMGTVIDHQENPAKHRKLSQALDGFARRVAKIVHDYKGALVYAGGDDVVALLPLHTAIDCTRVIAESFKTALEEFSDEQGKRPTLSAGIAIVHHLDPLQDSVELARKAEKKAKQQPQKNALAVTVSKRSGVDYTVVGEWGEIDKFLKELTDQCVEDNIPDGTAYEWENLIQRLAFPDDPNDTNKLDDTKKNKKNETSIRQKVLQADAVRILQRKLSPLKANAKKKKAVMDLLGPNLGFTYEKAEGEQAEKVILHPEKADSLKLEELTNTLLLAQLLADAQRLTQPK